MFSLSSFSSILPFLILAITYFAGLTTYSISFAQNKLNKKRNSDKCIQYKVQEKKSDISITNLSNFETENYFETEKDKTYSLLVVISKLLQIKRITSPPFCAENFERSLYMRPPPLYRINIA